MKAWIVFLLLGIAAIGGSLYMVAVERAEIAGARDWPSVGGRILSSRVEEQVAVGNRGSRIRSYVPRVVYSYSVDGRPHRGDRLWLTATETWGNRGNAEAFLEAYRPGADIPVFYDPADPQRSALVVESGSWWMFLITALGVLLAGLGLCLRRARRVRGLRPEPAP